MVKSEGIMSKVKVENCVRIKNKAIESEKSPIRLTIIEVSAAVALSILVNQKPINKKENRLMNSHPIKSMIKLELRTRKSILVENPCKKAKNLIECGS